MPIVKILVSKREKAARRFRAVDLPADPPLLSREAMISQDGVARLKKRSGKNCGRTVSWRLA